MKPHSAYRLVRKGSRNLAIALVSLLAANATQSATLYWDTNGIAAGSGAATGVWGTSNFWNTDSTGVANTFSLITTAADNLVIAAGINGTTGTLTVNGAQSANSITFDDNVAVTLAGTSINLGSTTGAGVFVASGDNAANTISTGLVLGAAATIQNAGTGVLTLNTGSITGTGNLTLQNNNTTAGGIVLSGPTVNNVGSITNSGGSTGGVTISAIIGTNVTGVTQNSSGSTLTLSGANLFRGDAISAAGTLIVSNNLALQNSALDTSGAGVLTLTVATPTIGGLKGSANLASVITTGYTGMTALTLNPGSGVSNSYGGIISNGSGNSTLTLTGAYGPGTQVLTGANSYTGLTTISGGTLQIGDGSTGSLNAASGLTFNTYGGTFKVKEAAASTQTMGALTFTAGSNTVNSDFNATSATLTFASLAARGAGATGNFTSTGGGTDGTFGGVAGNNVINFTTSPGTNFIDPGLFFNGSSYALYDTAGATSFLRSINYASDTAAGTESITASAAAFTAGKLHEQVSGAGIITAQGSQTITTLNLANSNNFTLTGGATLQLKGLLKSGNAAGGIISGGTGLQAATSGGEIVVRTDGANDTLTINTPIILNGASLLTKTGAGTLTLGAANTYTGATTIVAGKLAESATGLIADTSALTVNGPTAIFDLGANHNDTVAAVTLDGGGQITGSGTSTLTGSSYALKNGSISAILGTGNVTKSTNGTVTLTGNTTNTGGLNVSAGSLVITGIGAQYKTTNGGANINSGGRVTVSAGGAFNTGQAAGELSILSGSSVTVTGAGSSLAQGTNLNVGQNANSSNNSLTLSNGATASAFTFYIARGNNQANMLSNTLTITGAGSRLDVGNAFEMDNGVSSGFSILNGGTLNTPGTAYLGYYANCKNNTLLVDGANSVWNAAGVSNWWRGLANAGNATTVSNGGRINFKGGGNAEQSGNFINLNSNGVFSATTLSLNSNTMVFNGGILEARSSATTVSGGGIVLAGTGTVDSNTFSSTVSSPITGAGALYKVGAGTLTLSSASNAYTGGTVVSGGTVLAAAAANLPSAGNLTINAGGNVSMVNGAAVATYTANSLILVGGANLAFDLVGTNVVDKLTSTNAATTSGGNIGISINGVTTPVVSAPTTLISSASGGLLSGSTHYLVANNTNYTATLSESATDVSLTGYTGGATALTNAYWFGGQVTNALGSMNLSSGTTSNWATSDVSVTADAAGVVPGGSTVNVFFSNTSGNATQQSAVTLDADMTLGTLTFNDSNAVTISGSHYLTLMSTGTGASSAISVGASAAPITTINANLVLGAAQTWTVATGKTLAIGGSVLNGGFGLSLAGTGDVALSGSIIGTNGAGGITQTTTGTVTLSAANTYSGTTAVNAGTLTLSGSGTLGSTATASLASLTLGGGKLDLGATGQTVGAVSITAALGGGNNTIQNGNLTGTSYAASNTSGNAIVTANLLMNASGSAGLTVSGNGGTLTLTGANTYIGTTNVSSANATLQIGNNTTTGSLNPSSAITLTNAAATLAFNRSNTITQGTDFASVISGTGVVSQIGSGTLALNGTNTYSGGTKVSSGTLTAGSATAFGTGTLTINGGALDSSVAGLALTNNNVQVWNADFAYAGTNSLNLGTGTVSLGSTAGNRMVTVTANTLTVGGIISNGTADGLTKAGNGTLILSGNNAYTGTSGIDAGTLQVNHSAALGNGGNITFGGGTLQFSSVFNNATAAWGARIVNSTAGAVTLDTNGQNLTVSGNIDSSNTAGLTKSGGGNLTLTGTNTYSGTTTVSTGKLYLNGSNAGTAAINVAGSATLGGNGSASTATATVASGGIIEAGSGGTGTLGLAGLAFSGTGTIQISNVGNYTSSPALNVSTPNGLTNSGSVGSVSVALLGTAPSGTGTAHLIQYSGTQLDSTAFNAFTLNTSGISLGARAVLALANHVGYVDLNYSLDYPVWSGAGDGNWITSPNLTVTPTTNWTLFTSPSTQTNFIASDTPTFNDSASGTTVSINGGDVSPGNVIFGNILKNFVLQGTNGISGGASLTKEGAGQLTITNANSYTGGTTISGGTLSISADNNIGNASGALALGTGGILHTTASFSTSRAVTLNTGGGVFSQDVSGTTLTVSNTIGGGGGLTQSGPGNLILSGSNNYNGNTTLDGGTLTAGNATAFGNGTGTITINGGALDSSVVGLVLTGSKAHIWNGDFGFTGSNSLDLGTGTVDLGASGVATTRILTVNASTLTVSGVISNGTNGSTTGLTKAGGGTLVLPNANTYSGATSVNDGILQAGSTTAFGPAASASLAFGAGSTGKVQLYGNSMTVIGLNTDVTPGTPIIESGSVTAGTDTLTVNNATDNTYAGALQNGSTRLLALTKTGGGKLTLSGTNTYTGATAISGGILSFGAASNLPTNATNITFNNGGRLEYTGTSSVGNYTFTGGNSDQYITVADALGNVTATRSATNYNALIKDGPGTLTVTSNFQDAGGLTVLQGTAILSNTSNRADWYSLCNSLSVSNGATVKLGNNGIGIIYYGGPFAMSGGTFDVNGQIPDADQNHSAGAINGSGTVTNSSTTSNGLALFQINGTPTFSGNMTDGASKTLAMTITAGNGPWTLSGINTYSGATTINSGTLQAGSTTALSPNSAYSVAGGKTLNLASFDNSIGSLTGAGNVTLGTAQLTLGNDNTSPPAYSGVISSTGSPVTSLVKTGSGIQSLSGINTYTGATSVSQGTLKLADGTSTNNIANSSSIHIASAAILDVSGLSGAHLALASGQTLMGNGSVTGGSVTVSGGSTLAPGASAGTLNFGSGLTLADGSVFNWENNTVNTLGTAGSNWDVANVTGGATTISSTASTGAKLKLMFTDALTNFSDSFWNTSRTWKFITGGVSATNLFDTSNIAVFINSVQQGLTNIITDEGAFSTAVNGSDLDLRWTSSGGAPEIAIAQDGDIASGSTKGFGSVVVGTNTSLTFTISNIGTADLNLTGTPKVAVSGDADFTVTAQPSTPVTSPTGTTTFIVQFAPTLTGARTATLTIANDDSDEGTFTIILTGSGTTHYDVWALGKGLTGLPGSATDPAFDADPDDDGIKNGLEWVLGGNPTQNDAPNIRPTVSVSGGSLIQTFKREETSISETALVVEYGSDLVTWPKSVTLGAASAPADGNGVVVTINTAATPDAVTVNIPTSGNAVGGKLFARMKVTRVP